jgi:endonuclease/exonuclease/phosphatase family metal-dependent hydrolase
VISRSAISLALVAAPAVPPRAGAPRGDDDGEKVTVMTRNVFLGADLGPAIGASDIPSAIDGAGEIWNEVVQTNFPERAVPLAEEIRNAKPDLVGLQEVAHWQTQVPSDGGGPPITGGTPASETAYDFLELLTDRLGSKYRVVGVQNEFAAELPADVDRNDATGSPFGADLDARLTMRDVILARKGTKTKNLESANYETRFETNVGGIPVAADRGWLSVDANVDGAKFRFANTHLEAFGDPTIREAQAKELVAELKGKEQVVLVGDLNSGTTKRHNIGLPSLGHDPNDPLAFKVFQKAKYTDNGAVQSCCYPDITDETFEFTHTVDHVLSKPALKSTDEFVTGNDPSEMTPSGLWPADHGGVVSTLTIP